MALMKTTCFGVNIADRARQLSCAALVIAVASITAEAAAQTSDASAAKTEPSTQFGRRSSVVLGVDNVFGYVNEGVSSDKGGRPIETKGFFPGLFGPRLGVDGVFDSGLSLGAGLQLYRVHLKGSSSDGTIINVAPRVGYVVPFEKVFGAWLRAGPNVMMQVGDDDTTLYLAARLEGFFVITPAPHFGILAGPSFDFGLATSRSKGSNEGKWHSEAFLLGLFGEL
jgi:hypothetical protein